MHLLFAGELTSLQQTSPASAMAFAFSKEDLVS
jgi:hypothetical protein